MDKVPIHLNIFWQKKIWHCYEKIRKIHGDLQNSSLIETFLEYLGNLENFAKFDYA
jgi:hypothetical protein